MTTKIPDRLDRETHAHKFGVIEFRTKGAGLFFASEGLQERIRSLPADQLREANRAAWKARRKAERLVSRYAAASASMDSYDRASHSYHVAKNICDVTWGAIRTLDGERTAPAGPRDGLRMPTPEKGNGGTVGRVIAETTRTF